MSDRMTGVRPRAGGTGGYALWGRVSRTEAIAEFRKHHQHQAEQAARMLALTDDELLVETYLGPWAQKSCQEVTE